MVGGTVKINQPLGLVMLEGPRNSMVAFPTSQPLQIQLYLLRYGDVWRLLMVGAIQSGPVVPNQVASAVDSKGRNMQIITHLFGPFRVQPGRVDSSWPDWTGDSERPKRPGSLGVLFSLAIR